MYRYPFTPYPNGWFRLAYTHEVKRGQILRTTALGQELVVFRGEDGRAAVIDAFCPHLGADLSAGGKVVGNAIACPFHQWQFAGDGRCVKIPYCEKIPAKARTRSWPVVEKDGVVYFYFDAEGRAPAFDVPDGPYRAGVEWSRPMYFRWKVRMHIQEVVENAVDTAHFPVVHAYAKPPVIEKLETSGASFTVKLQTQRFGMNFVGSSPIQISYTGMGVTHAHLTARLAGQLSLEAGVILNATPIDEEHCEITIMARYRKSRWNPLWNAIVRPIMQHEIASDFANDIPIWEAKRYHEKPVLSAADGPIHVLRKWCRQFYTAEGLLARHGEGGLAIRDSHLRLAGFPRGWFALAFSAELPAGAVLRRRAHDQELVVFRTASGRAAVLDAYCPHLGAHLGEGGRVVGEELRCPFHGLGFAPDGACSRNPYGNGVGPKPRLRARTFAVREQHGVILAALGEPGWELAPVPTSGEWSAPVTRLFSLRTHPQEIIENTVDVGHFTAVHGYARVDISEPMRADGPHLTMGYTVTRERGLLGPLDPSQLRLRLAITASGVGYSRVEVSGLPLPVRAIVMPTPVDGEMTEVRVVTQVGAPPKNVWTRFLPRRALADLVARIAAAEMARDFAADIRIWEHKRYQDPPRLVPGDGPIGPYRRWARQFTTDARVSLDVLEALPMKPTEKKIPSGWYYVADTTEIKAGQVVRKELFGQTLALWRSAAGVMHVSEATCPHLGSDLSKLGKVVGEHLQCFSHRFEYDGDGHCVKTPRAQPCRTQNVLYQFPVHEIAGFVLAWYDARRRAPEWRIPDEVFSPEAGRFVKSQFTFECAVETINEDNFDVGHLFNWHELSEVKSTLPTVDRHMISVVHDFKRHSILTERKLPPPFHVLSQEITSRYGSTLYGHGLTYSFIDLPLFDFTTQDFIWATPISATRSLYTTSLRRRLPSGARTLKQKLVDTLLHPILFPAFVVRLRLEHKHQGRGFWENQRPVTRPIITELERPMLAPYWEWCRQFDADEVPPRYHLSVTA